MLNTPILFIIFNRLDTAQQVFNVIKKVQPRKLYIAADGPRTNKPGEVTQCMQTRKIIEQVDWACEVKTCFLNENKGPSLAPYTFIKWFFAEEDKGIILEHDCLPHPDFFYYCEDLLIRYENHPQIGSVSGPNFQMNPSAGNSYTFSAYNHIWGWASWKRVIDLYDIHLEKYKPEDLKDTLNFYFDTPQEKAYWSTIYKQIKKGKILTWDYHLTFALWYNRLYSIHPDKNLVSNIGFGEGAVNTTDINSPLSNVPTYPIMPLKHNTEIKQNRASELLYLHTFIMENKGSWYLYLKLFLKRMGWFNTLMKLKNNHS